MGPTFFPTGNNKPYWDGPKSGARLLDLSNLTSPLKHVETTKIRDLGHHVRHHFSGPSRPSSPFAFSAMPSSWAWRRGATHPPSTVPGSVRFANRVVPFGSIRPGSPRPLLGSRPKAAMHGLFRAYRSSTGRGLRTVPLFVRSEDAVRRRTPGGVLCPQSRRFQTNRMKRS